MKNNKTENNQEKTENVNANILHAIYIIELHFSCATPDINK
jgi:hypothetical protein